MGWLRNKLAGWARDSSFMREIMNVPSGGFMQSRMAAPFTGDEQTDDYGGPGGAIVRLVKRLPGQGMEHELNLYMYHVIKEAIPIAQNAVENRRFLEGNLVIKSKDTGLQRDLEWFRENVRIGQYAREAQALKGLDTAINALYDNSDTYGLSIIEPELSENGSDIERLLIPHSRTFFYKKNQKTGEYSLYQKRQDGQEREITDPSIILFAFRYNTEGAWPIPLYWGLPFTTEVMIRMLVSMNNLWWKAGDPSSLYAIAYDKESRRSETEMEGDLDELQDTIEKVMRYKRSGKVSDGFIALKGGTVQATTIGANALSESLAQYFREHYTTIAGQIVARSATPPWMYPDLQLSGDGLGSSRADQIDSNCMAAAGKRNEPKVAITKRILNLWLTLTKSATYVNRYEADWEYANLIDEKRYEEIRQIRHNADTGAIENVQRMTDLEIVPEDEREAHLKRLGVLPLTEAPATQ